MADISNPIAPSGPLVLVHTDGKAADEAVLSLARELATFRTPFLDNIYKATGVKQISHARHARDLISQDTRDQYSTFYPSGFRGMNLEQDGVLVMAFNQECMPRGCEMQYDTLEIMLHEISHRIGYLPDQSGVPMQHSEGFKKAYHNDIEYVREMIIAKNQEEVRKIDTRLQAQCGKTSEGIFDIQKNDGKCGDVTARELADMDDEMFMQSMVEKGLMGRGPVDHHYLPSTKRPEEISRKEAYAQLMGLFLNDVFYEPPPDYKNADISMISPETNDLRSLFPRSAAYIEKEFKRLQTVYGNHEPYPEGRQPEVRIEITFSPLMRLSDK
jgi:hypothetical protein